MRFMREMLNSRRYVVIGLSLIALFFIGAVLGSLKPNFMIYLAIAAVAIAAVLLIVYGCTGHVAYKEAKRNISSSSNH